MNPDRRPRHNNSRYCNHRATCKFRIGVGTAFPRGTDSDHSWCSLPCSNQLALRHRSNRRARNSIDRKHTQRERRWALLGRRNYRSARHRSAASRNHPADTRGPGSDYCWCTAGRAKMGLETSSIPYTLNPGIRPAYSRHARRKAVRTRSPCRCDLSTSAPDAGRP